MNHFLKPEDIEALKKDTCLFCNGTFPTKERIGSYTKRVGSDDEKEWVDATKKVIYCADLDIYHFTFDFPKEERESLAREREELYKAEVKSVQRNAGQRKEDLERILPLEGREKTLAVEAIVSDILRSVDEKSMCGSEIRRKLEAAYYQFFFTDLERACYERGKAQGSCEEVFYKPACLKTHVRCWPYAPVLQDRTERVNYRVFLAHLEQTRIGKGYTAKLEEYPELFACTPDLHIDLKIKRYNPLEFL